jgi:ABC-type amino acid transport substrate-binding protein
MSFTKRFKKFVGLMVVAGAAIGGLYGYKHYAATQHDQVVAAATMQGPQSMTATQPATASPQAIPQVQPVADGLQSILQNRVVRISVENPSEPFYGEANGVPHGFNVEFAHLLFAQPEFAKNGAVTIDTHHEVSTYADVPRQLLVNDGTGHTVDVAMDGLTFADNVPAGVVYSVPYIDDFGYALIVQQGSPIHSAADLQGRTCGILQGDPDVKAYVARKFPTTTFVQVSDADDQFIAKAVDNHTVDCFIYDYPFAVKSIEGSDLRFAITKLDGSSISYKIGVRASDQSLLIYLNSAIAKVKNSPAYLDLLRKYFISNQVVTTAASSGEHTYTVRQGDTLNSVAASQLGSGQRYRDIQQRNNLPNPNLILVGQRLVIPAR